MRALLIGDRCGAGGGTSGQLALAAVGLAARGHRVTVILAERPREPLPGVDVTVVPRRRALGGHARWLRRVDEHIRGFEGPALSWIRGPAAPLWRAGGGAHRAWLAVRGPRPFPTDLRDRRELAREARSVDAARTIVVNSRKSAGELEGSAQIDRRPCRLVRNGVDLARFCPGPAAERGRVVAFVGQGWWRKGLDVALRAFSACAGANDRLRVVAPRRDLAAAWRACGLAPDDRVQHLPPGLSVSQVLGDASALLLPSRYDASSNVVLEALACGVPTVVSAADGASEILVDDALVLRDVEDASGVARALRYALMQREPERWRDLASRWPESRMVSGLEELLMESWHG